MTKIFHARGYSLTSHSTQASHLWQASIQTSPSFLYLPFSPPASAVCLRGEFHRKEVTWTIYLAAPMKFPYPPHPPRLVDGLFKFIATPKALLMGSKTIWPKSSWMFIPMVMHQRFYACMKRKDLNHRGQLFTSVIKGDSQMCVHEGSVVVVVVVVWKNEGRNCADWQNSCFISIIFPCTFIHCAEKKTIASSVTAQCHR